MTWTRAQKGLPTCSASRLIASRIRGEREGRAATRNRRGLPDLFRVLPRCLTGTPAGSSEARVLVSFSQERIAQEAGEALVARGFSVRQLLEFYLWHAEQAPRSCSFSRSPLSDWIGPSLTRRCPRVGAFPRTAYPSNWSSSHARPLPSREAVDLGLGQGLLCGAAKTRDVVRHIVIPETAAERSCYMERGPPAEKPSPPRGRRRALGPPGTGQGEQRDGDVYTNALPKSVLFSITLSLFLRLSIDFGGLGRTLSGKAVG